MSRAVVHNPKDAASGPVGLLVHDFADEAIHRSNSSLYFTAAEDVGAMDLASCQVGPSALAKVLVLDANGTVGSGRQGGLFPAAGLNAGLFVGRDDVVVSAQRSAFPDAFVQIEDRTGFVGKVGIAREDPASMLPGAKGIAAEPAPQRSAADLGNQALRNYVLADLLDREAGQRKSEAGRELASPGLYLHAQAGGESRRFAPPPARPPDPA